MTFDLFLFLTNQNFPGCITYNLILLKLQDLVSTFPQICNFTITGEILSEQYYTKPTQ